MTTDAWPGIGLTPVAHEDDLVVQTGRLAYRNPRSTNQPRILSQERCADTVPAGHAKRSLRSVESLNRSRTAAPGTCQGGRERTAGTGT